MPLEAYEVFDASTETLISEARNVQSLLLSASISDRPGLQQLFSLISQELEERGGSHAVLQKLSLPEAIPAPQSPKVSALSANSSGRLSTNKTSLLAHQPSPHAAKSSLRSSPRHPLWHNSRVENSGFPFSTGISSRDLTNENPETSASLSLYSFHEFTVPRTQVTIPESRQIAPVLQKSYTDIAASSEHASEFNRVTHKSSTGSESTSNLVAAPVPSAALDAAPRRHSANECLDGKEVKAGHNIISSPAVSSTPVVHDRRHIVAPTAAVVPQATSISHTFSSPSYEAIHPQGASSGAGTSESNQHTMHHNDLPHDRPSVRPAYEHAQNVPASLAADDSSSTDSSISDDDTASSCSRPIPHTGNPQALLLVSPKPSEQDSQSTSKTPKPLSVWEAAMAAFVSEQQMLKKARKSIKKHDKSKANNAAKRKELFHAFTNPAPGRKVAADGHRPKQSEPSLGGLHPALDVHTKTAEAQRSQVPNCVGTLSAHPQAAVTAAAAAAGVMVSTASTATVPAAGVTAAVVRQPSSNGQSAAAAAVSAAAGAAAAVDREQSSHVQDLDPAAGTDQLDRKNTGSEGTQAGGGVGVATDDAAGDLGCGVRRSSRASAAEEEVQTDEDLRQQTRSQADERSSASTHLPSSSCSPAHVSDDEALPVYKPDIPVNHSRSASGSSVSTEYKSRRSSSDDGDPGNDASGSGRDRGQQQPVTLRQLADLKVPKGYLEARAAAPRVKRVDRWSDWDVNTSGDVSAWAKYHEDDTFSAKVVVQRKAAYIPPEDLTKVPKSVAPSTLPADEILDPTPPTADPLGPIPIIAAAQEATYNPQGDISDNDSTSRSSVRYSRSSASSDDDSPPASPASRLHLKPPLAPPGGNTPSVLNPPLNHATPNCAVLSANQGVPRTSSRQGPNGLGGVLAQTNSRDASSVPSTPPNPFLAFFPSFQHIMTACYTGHQAAPETPVTRPLSATRAMTPLDIVEKYGGFALRCQAWVDEWRWRSSAMEGVMGIKPPPATAPPLGGPTSQQKATPTPSYNTSGPVPGSLGGLYYAISDDPSHPEVREVLSIAMSGLPMWEEDFLDSGPPRPNGPSTPNVPSSSPSRSSTPNGPLPTTQSTYPSSNLSRVSTPMSAPATAPLFQSSNLSRVSTPTSAAAAAPAAAASQAAAAPSGLRPDGQPWTTDVLGRPLAAATPVAASPQLPHRLSNRTYMWNLLWSWSAKVHVPFHDLLVWQRVNHFPQAKQLTRKDLLKRHLFQYFAMYSSNRIGSLFATMPTTFTVPRELAAFAEALERASVTGHEPSVTQPAGRNLWIMKPVGLSRGRGIALIEEVPSVSPDDPVVVQRYVTNPLLIQGYKWDLRLYVLVTSFHPLEAWMYQEGFARFSTSPFTLDPSSFHDRFVHLTNSSVQHERVAAGHLPDFLKSADPPGGSKLSLSALRKLLEQAGVDWEDLWSRISQVVTAALFAVQDTIPPSPNSFELFGFDVLVDKELRVWLIEVNSSPSMSLDTPLDRSIKPKLIRDVIALVAPHPFDREALLTVLNQRIATKGRSGRRGVGVLSGTPSEERELCGADVAAILQGAVPRRYGELPANLGNFVCLSPSPLMAKLVKLKRPLYG